MTSSPPAAPPALTIIPIPIPTPIPARILARSILLLKFGAINPILSHILYQLEKDKLAKIERTKNCFPKNLAPRANKDKSIINAVTDGDISNIFFIRSNKPNTPPSVTPF